MDGRTYRYFKGESLYSFGHGLSYTSFTYTNLKVSSNVETGEEMTVQVEVTNSGEMGGEEVAQLYISHPEYENDAIRSLQGFRRLYLEPGETKTVAFTVRPEQMAVYHPENGIYIPKGKMKLSVGGGQPDSSKIEMREKILLLVLLVFSLPGLVSAESGENLWLRYVPVSETVLDDYSSLDKLYVEGNSPMLEVAKEELVKAIKGMTTVDASISRKIAGASVLLGVGLETKVDIPGLKEDLKECGDEGYVIKTTGEGNGLQVVISANSDAGVLYGTFAFIRMMQNEEQIAGIDIVETPKYQHRLLNHWDNLNGTVERGYAGHSIWWNRERSFDDLKEDYITYARANASVGINGTVLNNVNADPDVLTNEYIEKFARFAEVLRPYNIKVYMSVNFSSPAILGNLEDSDPLRDEVREWWKNKVKEIYDEIPDFGGFLVKANSEGQPGPQDYGRTHADGANMMAEALEPYGGIVMWRAFVYAPSGGDRAKQAYKEFVPLDGKFHENVIVQVKNGPIDFQPREPFSPVFGAMEQTPLMIEFQITQEYLGFSNHLAYLPTLQKETFESDTYAKGPGSTVAKTTDGSLFDQKHSAIAGVANIGRDINWTGHHFAQANWYAYGRLAWDHTLRADEIGMEWLSPMNRLL
jgi:alpha-glucuronidase